MQSRERVRVLFSRGTSMTEELKKIPAENAPTWEGNPDEFLKNLATDPVWVNTQEQRKEMREKFGLPEEPQFKDFPNYDAFSVAWAAYEDHFDEVTGCGKRGKEIDDLYWSGKFDEGVGTERSFFRIAGRLNYRYGKCSLEEVIAEWRRQNAN